MSLFRLTDASGAEVEVSADEAQRGLADGSLRAGRPMRVQHESGRVAEIPPDRLADALRSGRFRLDTPEDQERREFARSQTAADVGVTGAASTLREASLGASQLGEEALGIREQIDRMREANPTAAQVGDIAGMILPAIGTGGASVEARGLAEGASLAAEGATAAREGSALARAARTTASAITAPTRGALQLGERAASGISRAIAPEGASVARRILGRTLGHAAEGAIQGGAIEGGHILTEAALGEDPHDVADRLIASAGLGSVLGGTLGGSFATLGEGAGLARRGGRELVDLLRRQFTQDTGAELRPGVASLLSSLSDAAATGSSMASGRDRGAIRALVGLDEAGRAARRVVERGDEVLETGSRDLVSALDRAFRAADHVTGSITGGLKTSSVERVIGGDIASQMAQAETSLARVREMIAQIEADGGRAGGVYGQGSAAGARRMQEALRVTEQRLERAATAGASDARRGAEIFSALDDLKRQVGRSRVYARERYAQEALEGLYQELRAPLEDAATWGEGAAALQRESNAAWTPFLNWERDFARSFMREGEAVGFDRLSAADSARVRGFLGSLGTAANDSREQIFRDTLQALGELNESAVAHFDLSPAARTSASELRAALASVRETYQRVGAEATILNQYNALAGGGGAGGLASLLGGGAGAAAYTSGLGLASAGLGLAAGAASLLANPQRAVRVLSTIERLARQTDGRIAQSVRGFFGRTARVARAAGTRARRAASFGAQAYRDRLERLDRARDPGLLARDIGRSTEQLSHAAPRVQAAVQARAVSATTFLQSRRPRGMVLPGDILAHAHERLPSRTEMDRFMRYARAVDDPTSVLDDLRSHDLSPESVEALRAVYPALYQRLVAAVTQELASSETRPSYQDRIQLGILFGIPTDPSLTPESIAVLQSSFAIPAPTQPPSVQSRAPDIAGAYASDTDRLAARRSRAA